jgi:hypothetical protein
VGRTRYASSGGVLGDEAYLIGSDQCKAEASPYKATSYLYPLLLCGGREESYYIIKKFICIS